ncbi:MAG: hypothetical protein KKC23_02345 [Proteobacteria bacterium]|nr:hypothetical protein [Pseudomonadota bacterium]
MPGIFGTFKKEQIDLNQLMADMISSMNDENRFRVDKYIDAETGLCFGRVSLGILSPVDQPLKDREGNCWIVFHGELYGNKGASTDPEYALNQYIEKGDKCASELNGIFHFAIYDKRSEQIKLFSDKFGLQPLYYSVLPDGIIFAAEVKTLLGDEDVGKAPDYRSFADFLHYGQILGQKTLFKDIELLAPGSVLTCDLRDCKVAVKKYWHLDKLFVEKGAYSSQASAEDAVLLLVKSIKKRSTNKEILGLSLSGGLDSRGILAGLGKDAEGIRTYTLGIGGCADQRLAERMARVAKTNHEFIELDQGYLHGFENMAMNMIRLSDGMYHPHESTEMLALEYFKKAPFKILLRGHGGEIAKAALAYPVMVTPQVHSCSSSREILAYIFNITNLVMKDTDPGKLFTPSFRELVKEVPEQSLQESCGKVSGVLAPADVCIYYYINEHIRRQVVASLEIFRTQVEIRTPYVDEVYIKSLLSLPVSERNEGEIHFKLIKR